MFNIDTSYRARHYGGKNVPKYIVVHYTANDGTTATAQSNANYFAKTDREASAHYIVDEGDTVYCCVPPSNAAWAVGDSGKGRLKGIVTNFNSISVEMVSHSNKDGYYIPSKTLSNAIELIRQLMSEYKIPISNVVRHYDITGKLCPKPYVDEGKWQGFLNKLKGDDEMTEIERKKFNELVKAVEELANPMIYGYIDSNMPQWAHEAVKWAVENGIVKGDGVTLALDDKDLKYICYMHRMYKLMKGGK